MRPLDAEERALLEQRYAALTKAQQALSEAQYLFNRAVAWAEERCELPSDGSVHMVPDLGMTWCRQGADGKWVPVEGER